MQIRKNSVMNQNMMINQIIIPHNISEKIAEIAFLYDRRYFVPAKYIKSAYQDRTFYFDKYGFILNPATQLKMIDECEIHPNDSVLEIGSNSGYATIIMSKLGANVLGMEKNYTLVNKADKNLARYEVENSVIVEMLYKDGYEKNAPYDVIIINGAICEIPHVLKTQLAVGGRLVTLIQKDNFIYGIQLTKTTTDEFQLKKFYNVSSPLFNL